MRRTAIAALATAVTVLVAAGSAGAQPAPGFTELDSVSSTGAQGNQDSELPAVSTDGRFVAFVSLSDNLVLGDTNSAADVFVRDRLTGTTERVSDAPDGSQGNNWSFTPDLDGNGHIVVFDSFASNLGGDPNATVQVFLRDLDSGVLEPVSAPGSTDFLENSNNGRVSPDGRFVVFDQRSSTVSPRSIVLVDRATGTREIESVNDKRKLGNDDSQTPVVSPN